MPFLRNISDSSEQKPLQMQKSASRRGKIPNVINKSATKASIRIGFASFVHLSTLILTNTPNATSSPHVFVEAITNENFFDFFQNGPERKKKCKKCKTAAARLEIYCQHLRKPLLTRCFSFPSTTGEQRRRFQVNMSFAVNSFGEIFRLPSTFISFNDSRTLFLGSAHKCGPLKRSRLPIADQCKHYYHSSQYRQPFFTPLCFCRFWRNISSRRQASWAALRFVQLFRLSKASNGTFLRANEKISIPIRYLPD